MGSSFSASVGVGAYQDSTWISSSDGSVAGPQVNNIKWTHANSGSINGLSSVNLNDVPNYLSTLNIRFTNSTAVKTQNAQFRAYDRSNINNSPSGVTVAAAQIIHPNTVQTGGLGSGSTSWSFLGGSGSILNLNSSPGVSGNFVSGATTQSTQHDFYVAVAVSPNSIGSKQFALYASLEYL